MEIGTMKNTRIPLLIIARVVTVVVSCFEGSLSAPIEGPDDPPSGYVMKLERSGGYLGRHDKFLVYPDGRVLNSLGKTAWIPSESVAKWLDVILPVAVRKIQAPSSVKPLVCMDCYKYRITVYEEDTARVLSFTHPLAEFLDTALEDIGSIFDYLSNLPW
jgi:hypothetical protein